MEAEKPIKGKVAAQLERKWLKGSKNKNPVPALFLDRDGVIIEDTHYISSPDDVRLRRGVKEILKAADKEGWAVVIITNQSGIARGYFDWEDYERVNARMLELLNCGPTIKAIYANGHGPKTSNSNWRKPRTGMIEEAQQDLNLDLGKSALVGDRLTDLICGYSAGIRRLVHINRQDDRTEVERVRRWKTRVEEIAETKRPRLSVWLIPAWECFPAGVFGD